MIFSSRDVAILAIVPICCLAVYGVVFIIPPHNLVNFPFKGWPPSNGALFGISFIVIVAVAEMLFVSSEILK
jgi:hypothetical protein